MVQLSLFPALFQHISLKGVTLKRCWVAAAEIKMPVSIQSVVAILFLFHFTFSFVVPLLSSRMKGPGTNVWLWAFFLRLKFDVQIS